MNNIFRSMEDFGFNKWFQDKVDPETLEGLEIARVIAVHKDSYTITNGNSDVFAELVGKMLYGSASRLIILLLGIGYWPNFMTKILFQ